MEVKLLECSDEEVVLRAIARSHGNDIAKPDMIAKVIEWGHTSVLEHWTAVFDIKGISRSCLQQLVRHRIGMSYTVRSQRYCNEAGSDFHLPKLDYLNEPSKTQVKLAMQTTHSHIKRLYRDMLTWGVKQEDARYILPEATHTSLILTANGRSLRHFFELRLDKRAQAEIRELAGRMLKLVKVEAPNIFFE